MYTTLYSESLQGINGIPITIEVNITNGLPRFDVVGLPDQAVNEARERVIAAIVNSDKFFPAQRITINLAPADIKKAGSFYDLAFALGILIASGQTYIKEINEINEIQNINEIEEITKESKKFMVMGELALDGSVRSVKGLFSMLLNAKEIGIDSCIIPYDDFEEANIIKGMKLYPVKTLKEAVLVIEGKKECIVANGNVNFQNDYKETVDFSDVKGQEYAKRAGTVAAAGGHNFIMIGVPGSGKTLIAKRIPTILPPLTFEESLELTKIYSTQGLLNKENPFIKTRPFRIPHHTASYPSLVGGGHNIKAGEVTLAHHGVLFLDEFPEFQASVIQTLREPMEEHSIMISRSSGSVKFPANFTLIAAMNPCPCGYYGDSEHNCKCTEDARRRYLSKLSGPILDRIDIAIEVHRVDYDKLTGKHQSESSKSIRERVANARAIQQKRFKSAGVKIYSNSAMGIKETETFCTLDKDARSMLNLAVKKFALSARSYDKILKVSRTIADLEESEIIKNSHIAEALHYRLNILN